MGNDWWTAEHFPELQSIYAIRLSAPGEMLVIFQISRDDSMVHNRYYQAVWRLAVSVLFPQL